MTWYDRAMAYAQGNVASAYSHSLLAPLFELNETSPAYRRTGYAPHPIGPRGAPIAPLGGYALAIPSNIEPQRLQAVTVALSALTSANAAKLYLANGSLSSPRFSVSSDPEIRAVSPMIAAVDDMARRGLMRMWPRPPIPEISDVIAIAGEEIHAMLSGTKSIPHALSTAQNRADALMRSQGHIEIRETLLARALLGPREPHRPTSKLDISCPFWIAIPASWGGSHSVSSGKQVRLRNAGRRWREREIEVDVRISGDGVGRHLAD